MKRLIILSILIITSNTLAHAGVKFNVSAKVMPTNWIGTNDTDKENYNSKSNQGAYGVGFQVNRLYGRLSIQGGEYNFENEAPAQETKTNRTDQNNVIVEHGESDLLVGYYFWSRVSVFADLKSVVNKWKDSEYEMKYSGLGIGVSGFIPLKHRLMVFGSVGVLLPFSVELDGQEIGEGTGSAVDGGISYSINKKFRVFFGLKFQVQTFEFDNGNKQEHRRNSYYHGVQYQF